MRSSASIALFLIGATLTSAGYDAYLSHKTSLSDAGDDWNDGDFSYPATRPSSGNYSTHYSHSHGFGWFSSDYWHHSSSSGGGSSSISHGSTSRGGFGAHGHGGGHGGG